MQVTQVTAANESATELTLLIGICDPSLTLPAPVVVDSSKEIRVSINVRLKHANDSKSCAASATITLNAPLGARRVVDGHSRHPVQVIFTSAP